MEYKSYDYILADVVWSTGFTHKVPMRGFSLKSQIEFHKSLSHVVSMTPNVVTEEEYNNYLYGEDDGSRECKTETLKKTPAKRKPRSKASEDSKRVSKPRGATKPAAKRTASNGKEARNELREPKVRNVRKPKEDVARTNSTRKKSTSGNGNRKSKA